MWNTACFERTEETSSQLLGLHGVYRARQDTEGYSQHVTSRRLGLDPDRRRGPGNDRILK